jgi:transposase
MPRLSKSLITELEALRQDGTSIQDACSEVGLSTKTFYEWKKKAEAGENGLYAEFAQRVLPITKQAGHLEVPTEDWRRIDYFQDWASNLILDSGDPWEIEDWQLAPMADALSGQFQVVWLVVPEGNGKTTLTAGWVLYLLEHQITPEIPIGSATTTQAETLFRQIEGFIVRSDKLKDFNLAPGVRRIDSRKTRGHARVYPHNERSGDGVIPSGWVLDEGHLHPNLRLYRLWKGKYRKRRGVGVGISTAGEPNSEFEELRTNILESATEIEEQRDGAYLRAIRGKTVLHDWALRDREKSVNFEAVANANPLDSIVAEELEEKYEEPEMTEEHWLRRTCNIATRVEGQAITGDIWDGLRDLEISASSNSWKVGFLDLGWEIDTTAMGILAWESFECRIITGVKIIEPPDNGSIDEFDIVQGLVHLQREFGPVGWVFDKSAGGAQMAQLLEKGEHPHQGDVRFEFFSHSQDNTPMAQAASRFAEAVRNGWIRHDGHEGLKRHVTNAVRRPLGGEKWRFDRPPDAKGGRRKKFPIDALSGVLMGHNYAVDVHISKKNSIFSVNY